MPNVVLGIRVTLKGRLVKEFRFGQKRITIGRDPESHVFLDNAGISRCHAVLERQEDDIYLKDMESANGTLLNEESIHREQVKDGDKVRIGKFLLELTLEEERRGSVEEERPRTAAYDGTMVMDAASIRRLLTRTKEGEERADEELARRPEPVAEGNVFRMPQSAPAPGNVFPVPLARRAPRPLTALWWKSQALGLVIGFAVGLAAGALLIGLLSG